MVSVQELQNLDPGAWQKLLREPGSRTLMPIVHVGVEECGCCPNLVRYLLELAGGADTLPLVGKWTTAREARFYRDLAAALPDLTPRCWLAHVNREQSWLILNDVSGHFTPGFWTAADLERMAQGLAAAHIAFWGNKPVLAWLPHLLRSSSKQAQAIQELAARFYGAAYFPGPYQAALSEHGLRRSGLLAPALMQAGWAVELLRSLGGWPDVATERDLTAVADLLDDPVPMMQPLIDLPICLLHGNPAPRHWQLNLLDGVYLIDWQTAAAGPAVYDLAVFIEQLHMTPVLDGRFCEETLVDGYMLQMSGRLRRRFPARQIRQALPAARALSILTVELPKLVPTLRRLMRQPQLSANGLTDEWLRLAGADELIEKRPQLAAMFDRFWRAYQLL
jgi:hypothetical protein